MTPTKLKKRNEQIENNISELKGIGNARLGKYSRDYRLYTASNNQSILQIKRPTIPSYNLDNYGREADTFAPSQINVVKSVIDTLVSKMAQSKVRPLFSTVNGSYKDIKVVKQAQQFFDLYFDSQKIHRKVPEIFRDACIFEVGWAFVDADRNGIFKLLPWQVFFRPSELNYGKMTRVFIEQKDFPVSLLPFDFPEIYKEYDYVNYQLYFDTNLKKKYFIISDYNDIWEMDFESELLPVVPLFYEKPILGCYSQSVADVLNNIQVQINDISARIAEASQVNPALTYFVPETSNIKIQQLSNRIGNVCFYRPQADIGSNPVTVATPPFIDPQYFQLLDDLVTRAYEMVGVSQLSAQSKKPSGLDAAKALLTMEDVESERFEQQLNNVIKFYVELSKVCIDVFPKDEYILPPSKYRSPMKWGEIKKATDYMTIQYSGADVLSKDPSQKLQELQSLAQAGIIPATMVGRYLEIPDLEGGYSLATNATDAVDGVIDRCIEEDDFEVEDFIPYILLKEAIINVQLKLAASNPEKNKKDIEKLDKLYSIVEEKEKNFQSTIDQQTEEAQGDLGINTGSVLEQQANTIEQGTPNPQSSPEVGDVNIPTDTPAPRETGWNDNLQ